MKEPCFAVRKNLDGNHPARSGGTGKFRKPENPQAEKRLFSGRKGAVWPLTGKRTA